MSPSWMPEAADVLKCSEISTPSQDVEHVVALGKSESVAAKLAVSFETIEHGMHIPELRQESFVVANVGDRICSLAACCAGDSSPEVVCAAGASSPQALPIPGEDCGEGEGSIQIWTVHSTVGATFQFEVSHDGIKTDALEWCPSRHAFQAPDGHSCPRDGRVGLLLAVCSNGSVCIWAIPKKADLLKPAEPGNYNQKRLCLRPKVIIGKAQLAQQAPSAAAWSPHPPCSQIVIGTANGNVAIMHLHGAHSPCTPGVSPVSLVHVGGSMIRCLAWCPPTPTIATEDGGRTCFAVAAGQGQIAIFDAAEPQTAVYDLSLGGPGSTANDLLWLPGAGCSFLAAGTQAGQLRRIPLAQAASLSLFAVLAKPLDGVCALAYSDSLKLVGYSTGAGVVAVLACVARVNAKALANSGLLGMARIVPNAAVCQVAYTKPADAVDNKMHWSLAVGSEAKIIAPAECTTGIRSVDERRGNHVKEDALTLAHPFASVPFMTMVDSVDSVGRPCTTCICSTNSSLLVASRLSHN